jgi:hypothetical protein
MRAMLKKSKHPRSPSLPTLWGDRGASWENRLSGEAMPGTGAVVCSRAKSVPS